MYVLKICSKEMGGLIMANAAGTAQKMRRRKENHKFSRIMAVILGLIVTVEVMIAGGMIFNIDFYSADMVAVIMGFIVVYFGVVAILTDNYYRRVTENGENSNTNAEICSRSKKQILDKNSGR